MPRTTTRIATLAAALFLPLAVAAQTLPSPQGPREAYKDPAAKAPNDLQGVTYEQKLDSPVDLSLEFTDSSGEQVRLGDYFKDGKPVILALVYYDCPMLCTLELNGLLKAMRAIDLDAGVDYQVVTVSFDPGEGPDEATEKKDLYLRTYVQAGFYDRERLEEGWKFLTGEQEAISALADQVGFRYRYDEARDLFRHASGIVTLTPEGRTSRYQFGVEYSARDLKFALMEASDNKIGSPADAVMLYCFHYDPTTGKYGFAILNALRIGGAATLLLLFGFVGLHLWRDRRKAQQQAAVGSGA